MARKALGVLAAAVLISVAAVAQMLDQYLDAFIAKVKPEERAEFDAITKELVDANRRNNGDGGFLFASAQGAFAQKEAADIRVSINLRQRLQVIDGFGVNFNGTYFRDAQKPMIDMLIDDLGATIFRLDPYGLSNWEVVNDNEDANVINWEYYNDRYSTPTFEASWAAARYLNSRGIRPFLTLSGTAPDWMLDNKAPPPRHSVCEEGSPSKPAHLNPSMYGEFAEEIVSMLIYARTKARVDFEYFSPVNETDCYPEEGPRVDPDEMPKVLDAIAHRLKKEGLEDVKLVVPDQAILTNNYTGPILQDDELMKQVAVFSFHSYGEVFSFDAHGADPLGAQVQRIRHSKYPDARAWLTEYGDGDDRDKSQEHEWESFCLAATQRALRALNEGAAAALYFDAYDNYHEHYPRLTFFGLMQNVDHIYSPKKRYYAAKQLYHFVRPGSERIAAESNSPSLTASAFRNSARNEFVLVGVKKGGSRHVRVELTDATPLPAAWDLYETTRQIDCLKVDTVPVAHGAAEFDLPDEAIFTLVAKVKEHP